MFKKIGQFFADFGMKFLSAIPLLSNFIQVKIAEDDLPAIQNALKQFQELCFAGQNFAGKGLAFTSDKRLSLEEMEELARDLKKMIDEVGDFVDAIKKAT